MPNKIAGRTMSRIAYKRSLSKGDPAIKGNNREARREAEREIRAQHKPVVGLNDLKG